MCMVKNKKELKILLVFAVAVLFILGKYTPAQAAKTQKYSVALNKSVYTLKKGKTVKLKVTLNEAAKKKGVEWSSSNSKVASVSQNGKITTKKNGTATIIVRIKGTKVKAYSKAAKLL